MQLTEKIHSQLFTEILEGRWAPGARFPTELETSARFRASRVTVRRAYAELENSGIILRRKHLGTIVSSSYAGATGPIKVIAAIMPLSDTFSRVFLETLCAEASDQNVSVVIEPGADDGAELSRRVARLASNGIRNMIIWAVDRSFDRSLFQRLRILGVNLVFFDRIQPGDGFADFVGLDNGDALRTLVGDAASRGVRNLVFGDIPNAGFDSNLERRNAFVRECESRSLDYSFFNFPRNGVTEPGFLRGCCSFFENVLRSGPAALVCVNDSVAMTAAGCVPPSCLIYSIDGTEQALARGIVSYSQPMRAMARACMDSLSEQRRKGKHWKASRSLFRGELLKK